MNLCIISPCGKEDDAIEQHIINLHNALCEMKEYYFAVCFIVDEYTSEKTMDILKMYSEKLSYIHVCEKPKHRKGLAGCYIAGYEIFLEDTDCDFVLEMDIESHPYENIKDFIQQAQLGYDIVLGSRNLSLGKNLASFRRRLISGLGSFLCRSFLFLDLTDCTSGFQMFSRKVIENLDFDKFVSSSYFIQTELKARVVNELSNKTVQEIKSLPFYKRAAKRFFLMFSSTNSRRWKVKEIPFVYSGSASSINYKKVLKSFIEFLKLRKDLLTISIMAFIRG